MIKKIKEIWRKIKAFWKSKMREHEGKQFIYSVMKDKYVTFGGNREKMKLRQYIYKKANALHNINNLGHAYNRDKMIEAYEYGGIKGAHDYFTNELEIYVEVINASLTQ